VARARAVVGSVPALENVATLIRPPGGRYDEGTFTTHVLGATQAPLLLDLNNLYANAVNFGILPLDLLTSFPLERVVAVHLAGGQWVTASTGERRLLDDHRHDVSEDVFELLTEVGARAPQPLVVLIERDGAYTPFPFLLAELAKARRALAAGRARAASAPGAAPGPRHGEPGDGAPLEVFLARLYSDAAARARFLADPERAMAGVALAPADRAALAAIDRVGLELAGWSYDHKRRARTGPARPTA